MIFIEIHGVILFQNKIIHYFFNIIQNLLLLFYNYYHQTKRSGNVYYIKHHKICFVSYFIMF